MRESDVFAAGRPRRVRRIPWRRLVIGAGTGLLALGLVSFCVGSPSYYSHKYRRVPGLVAPGELIAEILPERQVEAHTCGFHSVSAVYRAYGIDPEAARRVHDDPTTLIGKPPDRLVAPELQPLQVRLDDLPEDQLVAHDVPAHYLLRIDRPLGPAADHRRLRPIQQRDLVEPMLGTRFLNDANDAVHNR